jgi:hypothetical protein
MQINMENDRDVSMFNIPWWKRAWYGVRNYIVNNIRNTVELLSISIVAVATNSDSRNNERNRRYYYI